MNKTQNRKEAVLGNTANLQSFRMFYAAKC